MRSAVRLFSRNVVLTDVSPELLVTAAMGHVSADRVATTNAQLVDQLVETGALKSDRAVSAFRAVDRGALLLHLRLIAEARDEPTPIVVSRVESNPSAKPGPKPSPKLDPKPTHGAQLRPGPDTRHLSGTLTTNSSLQSLQRPSVTLSS